MEDLTKKIQSMQLTKTDRRIADYILEHMDSMGFQTLTSLSIEIGISDTSIIRFIRKLGFLRICRVSPGNGETDRYGIQPG